MTVAGIDYSSRAVDIVLLDDDGRRCHWTNIPLHGDTPLERARSLRGRLPLRSWWEDEGVYLIGIEDPIGHHAHTAKALGQAGGAIAALLPASLTVLQTPTAEWKRLFCGDAKASKDDVREAVSRDGVFGSSPGWTQDAYDAYAIAWTARHLNNAAIERQKGAVA